MPDHQDGCVARKPRKKPRGNRRTQDWLLCTPGEGRRPTAVEVLRTALHGRVGGRAVGHGGGAGVGTDGADHAPGVGAAMRVIRGVRVEHQFLDQAGRGQAADERDGAVLAFPGLAFPGNLLTPTARRGTVARPELLDRMTADAAARLMLVVAPAGWGKSSLLREWCLGGEAPGPAWLSADRDDNDPPRFWSRVIAAVNSVSAGVGAAAREALTGPGGPAAVAVMDLLISDLGRMPGRVTLVIDDFHL